MLVQKAWDHCDRVEKGVCAKKGESILIVERRKRRDIGICKGSAKKGVYLIF